MNCRELKQRIGVQARSIIESGLGLKKGGQCPRGGHKKSNPVYEWKDDHFYCHDCGTMYDIIDYARDKFGKEWFKELHALAGVKFQETKIKSVKPVMKEQSQAGIKYLEGRGIRKDTLDRYGVRADNTWIYFNYALPGNKLVATKWRGITEKRFGATKGGSSVFYGLHLLKAQKNLIICEGEIDALTMAEIGKGAEEDFLCSSLPNGAKSLKNDYEDNGNYQDMFEKIIIIPDSDESGNEFKEEASELLSGYNLYCIDLPCKDVNEFYMNADYNPSMIFSYVKPLLPKLKSVSASDGSLKHQYKAWESGFWTFDNAIAGLQAGWVTMIYGTEGSGKTTLARQMLLAMAKQNEKSAMYVGEGDWQSERDKLTRLAYGKNYIRKRPGTVASALRFDATQEGIDKFRSDYGDKIFFLDDAALGHTDEPYQTLRKEIISLVRHGVKLIVIDSLSKLTQSKVMNIWDMQKYVPEDLKRLAVKYNIHIVLIHHTNAGGKMEGVQAIRRFIDVILKIGRASCRERV